MNATFQSARTEKKENIKKLTNPNCPRLHDHISRSKISLPAVFASSSPSTSSATTNVSISVTHQVPFGSHLRAVGEHPALGSWDPNAAPALEWSQGDNWKCELDEVSTSALGKGERLDFKLVVVHGDGELVRCLRFLLHFLLFRCFKPSEIRES